VETSPPSPLASWLAIDAPPGHEARLTDAILAADHRWHRDALGNLVLQLGSGSPRRLVACGLDHVGYAVTEITDDGYLRLHRIGNARTHPLWDQFHEAQQIRVLTSSGGSVPGVVAITNAHFARQHRADTLATDVDHFWVDVGAASRADVTRMGITLLDPVVRDVPPWLYGDQVAAPDASGRTGCAAVASAARATPSSGTTVFVLSTQRSYNWTGLAAATTRLPRFDVVTLVAPATLGSPGSNAVAEHRIAVPADLARALHMDSVATISVRARFAGSTVESVTRADADALLAAVQRAAGASGSTPWLALAAPKPSAPIRDSLSTTADLLARLSDVPAVPDHEWRMRDAVVAALPAWARARARVDGAGNVVVAFGPDRDTTVVVAHMDEVSYTVASIARDGVVTLTMRGGFMPSAWESVPALLHFDPAASGTTAPGSLPGIFVPRDTGTLRRPASSRAWFGMDSAALVARGVRAGMGVTAYKRAERLGATRFTARALDDRAGSTALLLAIARIDPARVDHEIIFVWSTAEETGLVGATALAREIGTSVRHVYAIDTFVSSDTPLESPHFAYALLGHGAVLRGLDDGSVVIPAEQDRIETVARTNHIPLQLGATQGSSDAVPFITMGATGTGLSWPGRYSHSPAEVLDLRDLNALVRLVDGIATAH
jgi:putative aminopeptidase FrvX